MFPVVFIVPGRLESRTGGYKYDRRIVSGLRERGWPVAVRELDGSFPHPTPAALGQAARALAEVPDGTVVVIDGLALGAMPAEAERQRSRLRIVALVHLPLAAEIGLERATAARLEASERRGLASATLVVVTGRATVEALTRYGVAPERIVVVEPGTAPAPVARGSGGPSLELLCVATLNPGKGHEILVRALATLPHRNWTLTCAGSLDRHPPTVELLRALLRENHLTDRVSLVGELNSEALAACYDRADLFVLATLSETFGMAVAEALARGLPVVSTTTGAISALVDPDGLPDEAAGLLVPPGDERALEGALSRALGDASLRERMAANARRVRDRLSTWESAVGRMAAALDRAAIDG